MEIIIEIIVPVAVIVFMVLSVGSSMFRTAERISKNLEDEANNQEEDEE